MLLAPGTLVFGDNGRRANFHSDDRTRSSPDGKTFTPHRFSTPVGDTARLGPLALAGHGDAQWRLPDGEFIYGEFEIIEVAMNAPPG